MIDLFGRPQQSRNPLVVPPRRDGYYNSVAEQAMLNMRRPANTTMDAIVQALSGGLAGLADRGERNDAEKRPAQLMQAFEAMLGGGVPSTVPNAPSTALADMLMETRPAGQTAPAMAGPSSAPRGAVGVEYEPGFEPIPSQPASDYARAVGQSESGGQMISNGTGSNAFGTYQFLPSTWQGLAERYPDRIRPDGITDPAQQEVAMQLFSDENRTALRRSLGREPTDAEMYAAHALGAGGAATFLQALQANPNMPMADVVAQIAGPNAEAWMAQNPQFAGATVSDMMALYARPFAGAQTAPAATAAAPAVSAPPTDPSTLSAALMSPQASAIDRLRPLLGFMVANGQEDAAMALVAQALMDTGGGGFRVLTPQQETALLGQDMPGTFQMGPDGRVYEVGGGGTNVTVNSPQYGSIPPGYQLMTDPVTGAISMQPIEGGPVDTANQNAQAQTERVGGIVLQDLGRALSMIESSDWVFGPQAAALQNVPGTGAYEMARLIDTIRANVGFEQLNAMRQSSPTGGALGQVTERELAFLQATLGSLDLGQSREQLRSNLSRVYNTFLDLVHGPDAGPPRLPLDFGADGRTTQPSPTEALPVPEGALRQGDADYSGMVEGQLYVAPNGQRFIWRGFVNGVPTAEIVE